MDTEHNRVNIQCYKDQRSVLLLRPPLIVSDSESVPGREPPMAQVSHDSPPS